VSRLSDDPEFESEWPPGLFEEELRRLIRRGQEMGIDMDWRNEVETLLRHAFSSSVPLEQFVGILDGKVAEYDDDPF
jgi:hypothetical protein